MSQRKYIKWGWATAFLLPIVGIGLGVYNIYKAQPWHGIGQIVVSIFMWSFWAGFFMAVA